MTKQILSASLKDDNSIIKGLYKNIYHMDSDLKEITLTVTVIEPDERFEPLKDKLKLFVKVSSTP